VQITCNKEIFWYSLVFTNQSKQLNTVTQI